MKNYVLKDFYFFIVKNILLFIDNGRYKKYLELKRSDGSVCTSYGLIVKRLLCKDWFICTLCIFLKTCSCRLRSSKGMICQSRAGGRKVTGRLKSQTNPNIFNTQSQTPLLV